MLFFRRCSLMDIFDAVYFILFLKVYNLILFLQRLYKRKQALLGSNLSGIMQMTEKNVKSKEWFNAIPLIFLEVIMPLKMYILIENYTTFPLKSIPLIEVKPVALQIQQQHKNDDKHGYKTRDYQTVLPGV